LLVPGGRWQTVTVRPVSAANFANSTFQARTRDPLEPPPSAQINNRSASGYRPLPMVSHQRRSVRTSNAEVSWSVPTDTHPAFADTS